RKVEHLGNPGLQPPLLMARSEATLTFEARVLGLKPDVLAELIIGSDGMVHNVEIYRPAGFGLDENAVAALMKWRFRPAEKDGRPIAVEGNLRLKFLP
ncbi:MAG: TonB family protein, partial [Acidobacteriaceae bacterium]|nr:TonB family protein [Acidobacteriaceae bacterium]